MGGGLYFILIVNNYINVLQISPLEDALGLPSSSIPFIPNLQLINFTIFKLEIFLKCDNFEFFLKINLILY